MSSWDADTAYDAANTEAHATWLVERPDDPVGDSRDDTYSPPNPYTSCAGGACWHKDHNMPCPESRWCPVCTGPLWPDEPDTEPCHRCLQEADDSRSDWTAA